MAPPGKYGKWRRERGWKNGTRWWREEEIKKVAQRSKATKLEKMRE